MRKMLGVTVVGVGLVLAMAPLRAHHEFSAEFSANKPITLKGTVPKMEWINPFLITSM